MTSKSVLAAMAWCILPAAMVQAHFVWIDVRPAADGQPTAQVWFSETPGPGEPHLIDKIAGTQAWLRVPERAATVLELRKPPGENEAALVADLPESSPLCLEAKCDYGIFSRGGTPRRLFYYAMHLGGVDERSMSQLVRSSEHPLSLVPQVTSTALILTPVWLGKPPAKGFEVVVYLPGLDEPKKLTADADRETFKLEPVPQGRFAARVRLLLDRDGEYKGQAYSGELYYSTLTMDLPLKPTTTAGAGAAAQASPAGEQLSAPQLLARARAARGTWDDFPGFRARLAVQLRGYQGSGQLTVSPDGDVSLAGFPAGLDEKRVKGYLESLVQHRLADPSADDKVEYVAESQSHPLGRLIKFVGDEKLQSTYRVQGDLITEVNRVMGELRFTIDVLDVHRDASGKYLPQTFTVSYWDKGTGALKRSETHVNLWTTVGLFELPRTLRLAQSTGEGTNVMELLLEAHELLPKAAAGK